MSTIDSAMIFVFKSSNYSTRHPGIFRHGKYPGSTLYFARKSIACQSVLVAVDSAYPDEASGLRNDKQVGKTKRGSVLVFTLFVFFVITTMVMSLFAVSIVDRKLALSTSHSAAGFQKADAAIERTMQAMRDIIVEPNRSLTNLATMLGDNCVVRGVGANQRAVIESATPGEYELYFFSQTAPLTYMAVCNTALTIRVKMVRAIGDPVGERRVIEVTPHFRECDAANEISKELPLPPTDAGNGAGGPHDPMSPSDAEVACGMLIDGAHVSRRIHPAGQINHEGVCPWRVPTLDELRMFHEKGGEPAIENGNWLWTNSPKADYGAGCVGYLGRLMQWKQYHLQNPFDPPPPPDFNEGMSCNDIYELDGSFESDMAYVRCVR